MSYHVQKNHKTESKNHKRWQKINYTQFSQKCDQTADCHFGELDRHLGKNLEADSHRIEI